MNLHIEKAQSNGGGHLSTSVPLLDIYRVIKPVSYGNTIQGSYVSLQKGRSTVITLFYFLIYIEDVILKTPSSSREQSCPENWPFKRIGKVYCHF